MMLDYWTEDGVELSEQDLRVWHSMDTATDPTAPGSFDAWLEARAMSLDIFDYNPAEED
jgi:hypothetical protein